MSRPITTTVTATAAAPTAIATSQIIPSAGNANLNGTLVTAGVARLTNPARVTVASNGNDSGLTITVTGTSRSQQNGGGVLAESFVGSNGGTATSTQDFATVTSVAFSGTSASTITIGTSATASGPWVVWSEFQTNFQVTAYGVATSGTPAWQVDYTYDDVFALLAPGSTTFPIVFQSTIGGSTATAVDGVLQGPIRASRLTLTSAGSAKLVQTQQGI